MKPFHILSISFVIGFGLVASSLFAQVGNDNATGISGYFRGRVKTGCSYDAYTGSVTRSISDITIAGGVGAYPLAFTRTSTSRYTAGVTMDMGKAGSWQHFYGLTIDTYTGSKNRNPTNFIVNYPDGSRIIYTDIGGSGAYILPPHGVQGRVEFGTDDYPITRGHCYVFLPDGGKVFFGVQIYNNRTKFVYTLQQIIDPYGQITTITHPPDGSTTVTEPAGRMLKMFYTTGPAGDNVIDRVEEWMTSTQQGRTVKYNYSLYNAGGTKYSALTSVSYLDTAGATYATATYTYQNDNLSSTGRPLLSTCNDPMYAGPMERISYAYATGKNPDGTKAVSGQLLSEKSGTSGQAVSTLSWPSPSPGSGNRKEITGDGRTRTFTFEAGGLVDGYTDFRGANVTLSYDNGGFIASATDRNGNTTNYTNTSISGLVTSVTFPTTPNDTPSGTQGSLGLSWGGLHCPDPNNSDPNHLYYIYSRTDEGGNATTYLRDTGHRITQVNYPDGGTESFTYNSFGQVLTHRLRTGGLETYAYDSRGRLTEFRDAYHLATADPQNPSVPTSATPSLSYQYDSLDRVSGVTDAQGSTTNYTCNWRGQVTVTTLPTDSVDGQRHTIVKQYNLDGTLANVTDQLGHVTSFTYDDYRRLRSMTTPGHNTPVTAYSYYDSNGTSEDYSRTDSSVTYAVSPGGERIKTTYDQDLRKISVIVGYGTTDAATTSYGYDINGNVTSVISPNEQPGQIYAGKSTISIYDERNRIMSATDALSNATSFKYDAAGRKASVTRANGQATTFDTYDAMNRLLQQTVKQTPDPDAVTRYTYYASGLLHTMQDPRLVAINSGYAYTYSYDLMGRKTGLNYPPDSGNAQRSELWHYDTAGRIDTFTNRAGNVQTFTYDALNRQTGFSWNDAGVTPNVTFGYDIASRLTAINNANATISRAYFDDNLPNTVTATYADNTARTVTYTYNADGNRATIQYPNGAYSFTYNYTARNQLLTLVNNAGNATVATYGYDLDGNLISRVPDNSAGSAYTYDALDRVTRIAHLLNGDTRTFDYAYDSVGNRKWTKRNNNSGDVFGYDLADQSISVLLNVSNPDTTAPGSQTINYDANGNRTSFSAYGPTDTYTTNNLNQYTSRNSSNAVYDNNGNITTGLDGSIYSYDAQNRLLTATKGGTTEQFYYDGLNRQVARSGGSGPAPTPTPTPAATPTPTPSPTPTPTPSATPTPTSTPTATPTPTPAPGPQCSPVTFTPVTGKAIKMTTTTVGATIFYTTDSSVPTHTGSTPTGTTQIYSAPVTVGNCNEIFFEALAYKSGMTDSNITTYDANYTGGPGCGGGGQAPSFAASSPTSLVYNVYDGWNLIAEYAPGATAPTNAYLSAAGGLVKNLVANQYYYQDASGSTSHLADSSGHLLEWYRYDLHGTPVFYNSSNSQLLSSAYSIRHLFTGQQWYSEIGLYDLRNRSYSPDIGRFLQSDPAGFLGDSTNLYRYCGNNPLSAFDPLGLWTIQVGFSGTIQLGPFAVSAGIGVAFDGYGNFGGYTTAVPIAAGAGADISGGISFLGSNADTIYGLKGWFAAGGGEGGVVGDAAVEGFFGDDAITGKPVAGLGLTGGLGAGGGGYFGSSYTTIYPWIGAPPATPSSAASGEDGRVIVYGTAPQDPLQPSYSTADYTNVATGMTTTLIADPFTGIYLTSGAFSHSAGAPMGLGDLSMALGLGLPIGGFGGYIVDKIF